mgnify:CR=1 FL=1
MKKLFLICGFPGVGKSVFSKRLAVRIPSSYHLDADEFFVKYNDNPHDIDKLSEGERTKWREKYIHSKTVEIEKLLREYKTVITDGTYLLKKDRNLVRDIALKMNAKLVIIRLVCSENVIRERIFSQRKHIILPENRWKLYQKSKEKWEEIEGDHIEINTNEKKIMKF